MQRLSLFGLLMLGGLLTYAAEPTDEQRLKKWEKDTANIEKRLAANPPKAGGIFFVGSSSIVRWNTTKAFPDRNTTNVGFGGSEIRDSTLYAEKLILKYEPKTIVFYAGDNDIQNNRSPETVRDDFQEFAKTIHTKLPKTTIIFIAIKPSVARWKLFEKQKKANELVKELCRQNSRLTYLDIVTPMLGKDGMPPSELFVKDGLHLSQQGYDLWADALRNVLK